VGTKRHSDQLVFIIELLWLEGHTLLGITTLVNAWHERQGAPLMRADQVKGIIRRGPHKRRATMFLGERQARIDHLMLDRLDGGFLADKIEAFRLR